MASSLQAAALSSGIFFAGKQPLEAAAMNGEAKRALQFRYQISGTQVRSLAP